MKKVFIIGAGQLGSRHLQALKYVKEALDISVIDPREESLSTAKERYASLDLMDNNKEVYTKLRIYIIYPRIYYVYIYIIYMIYIQRSVCVCII